MPDTAVLLHGFGGTKRSWDLVAGRLGSERYTPLALDLRGHGDARSARPVTFAGCVADVLAAAPPSFALCGYSMGGRVALHVALAAPERVARLVLVSTTAGIDDPGARAARRRADAALATWAETAPIDAFAARWAAQELFADGPPEAAELAREDMLRNDPAALAAVLRGIGTGAMQPLWDRLGELPMPATVLAGALDAKFVALAERLAAALTAGELVVVPGAGHRLALEAPGAVAAAVSAPAGPRRRGPASSAPRSRRAPATGP